MQLIPQELVRLLSQRLKLGDQAKPTCRVEVDRLAFVPGRTQNIMLEPRVPPEKKTLTRRIIRDGYTEVKPGGFTFPVSGKNSGHITSYWGDGRNHKGIDIGCSVGNAVLACWGGTVSGIFRNEKYTSWGYRVEISHGNGLTTRYAHLSEIQVNVGDKVSGGQPIALSGNTGDVWHNGHAVSGTYDNPDSERSKGFGAHLHFEVLENGNRVNPYPYMIGEKRVFDTSVHHGANVQNGDTYSGYPGDAVVLELFQDRNWITKPGYSADALLSRAASVEYGYFPDDASNYLVFDLSTQKLPAANTSSGSTKIGFHIKTYLKQPGLVHLGYRSDFSADGELRVYLNGEQQAKIRDFAGLHAEEQLRDLVFPAGDVDVRIEIDWNRRTARKFALSFVMIQELDTTEQPGEGADYDPTKSNDAYPRLRKIEDLLFNEETKSVELQVGQFVYMDTLVLENVRHIEIDDQFEMSSREARLLISNPRGFYSPDYNPYYFPENYFDTPWSYRINGFHVGVLSENTPIRIFTGYGQNLMRVFTGLIDRVDLTGEESSLTLFCRDMYKHAMNKVISEDKEYPRTLGHGALEHHDSRREEIIAKAKYYCQELDAKLDYRFLLALADVETGFGERDEGLPDKGSYILRYGVYSPTNLDPDYRGIDRQLHYGAKRYKACIPGGAIQSVNDVKAYYNGGPTGSVVYRPPGFADDVWSSYQTLLSDSSLEDIPAWNPAASASSTTQPTGTAGSAWLKSSIVHDLVQHAGLTGWRRNHEDLYYPDTIIEESYLIEAHQHNGKVVKAVPDREGEFIEVDAGSFLTPEGWFNPFVDTYRRFDPFTLRVSEAIEEVIKDTHYRSYCDRYGTYRLETINLEKPIAAHFHDGSNLVSITKTIDWSRAKSHVAVVDDNGEYGNFVDTELLLELKGEVRSTKVYVPWARSRQAKEQVAKRLFFDMKRLCQTLQVSIPGDPTLDVLDRVYVSNSNTSTRDTFIIKGLRTVFSVEHGYLQVVDLMWSNGKGAVI